MATCIEPKVRFAVVSNSACPAAVLLAACGDTNGYVRMAAAERSETPAAGLVRLANDEDDEVSSIAAETLKTLLRRGRS